MVSGGADTAACARRGRRKVGKGTNRRVAWESRSRSEYSVGMSPMAQQWSQVMIEDSAREPRAEGTHHGAESIVCNAL